MKYVVFQLHDMQYATPVHHIQSIERMLPIRFEAGMEYFELGFADLRGTVIGIQDLRKKLGVIAKDFDEHTRLLVTSTGGYIVDAALDVLDVQDTDWVAVAGRRVWNREHTIVLEYLL